MGRKTNLGGLRKTKQIFDIAGVGSWRPNGMLNCIFNNLSGDKQTFFASSLLFDEELLFFGISQAARIIKKS